MPVPTPGWGQHNISGRHIDPLAVHDGIDIVGGIEHETERSRGMAMRTRGLAGLDHLIGGDDVPCRRIRIARRRVYHDEVAPFSDIGAHEQAGLL